MLHPSGKYFTQVSLLLIYHTVHDWGIFVNTVFKGELNINLFETLHAVRKWITGNDDQALERIISTVSGPNYLSV